MHHQVLSVLLLNVLVGLAMNLVNKCFEQIDCYASLTAILCRLGCVEQSSSL